MAEAELFRVTYRHRAWSDEYPDTMQMFLDKGAFLYWMRVQMKNSKNLIIKGFDSVAGWLDIPLTEAYKIKGDTENWFCITWINTGWNSTEQRTIVRSNEELCKQLRRYKRYGDTYQIVSVEVVAGWESHAPEDYALI